MATVTTLTDVEYAAIGRIAVESAYLEDFVGKLIIRLCRVNLELGDMLIERGMFDSKLTLLAKVGEHLLADRPAKLLQLKETIKKIRNNNGDRTIAIHGRWVNLTLSDLTTGDGQRNPRAIKVGTGKDRVPKVLKASEAQALSIKIESDGEELWAFAKKTWPQLFALRLSNRRRRL